MDGIVLPAGRDGRSTGHTIGLQEDVTWVSDSIWLPAVPEL